MATALCLDGAGWAETPDAADLDITGDIDMRTAIALADWTPAAPQRVISKWSDATPTDWSYRLEVNASGRLHLEGRTAGGLSFSADSTVAPTVANGALLAIRVTVDVDNGSGGFDTNFYTKATTPSGAFVDSASDAGWIQLGATDTAPAVVNFRVGAARLVVGANGDGDSQFVIGEISATVLKDGINGITVACPDFTNLPLATTSFTDVCGHEWTLEGTAVICGEYVPPDPPEPPQPIPSGGGMSGLGCGDNQVFIADRNGRLLVELPFSELSYGRKLDDLSEASVSLGVAGLAGDVCCDVLSYLRPWEHLLIVYRDTEEVWVGIAAEPVYTPTGVTIAGRDLFQVFERRVLPFDRDFFNEDLSDIFRQYALDALSRDNSYGITVSASDSGHFGSRSVRTVEFRRAADEMRELAKIGVDFTMRGRQLIATGEQTEPSFKLITSDFVNQEIGIGGLQTATEVIVKGAQAEDGSQPIGIAGGVDPTLGLVQLVIDEDSITDEASAEAAAEAYLALLQEPPTVVSGILDARASVDFSGLVPGRVCDLRVESGCRRVIANMRLSEVTVSVSVGDEGTTESVGVTFVPVTLGEGG